MKKILLTVIVLVSLSIIMLSNVSLTKAESVSCNPSIQLVNQDPVSATPASYVKVVFEVSNLQGCNGFAVKLNPEYPFSLDPGYESIQTLNTNPYSPNYKSAWTIPYRIRIADDALEGDYNLKLFYHSGISTDFSQYYIEGDFNITISDEQTDFATVIQDQSTSSVSIGIVNTGKNTANSLIVSIPKQDNYKATGTSQQIVGNLVAGDYTIVSFDITASRVGGAMNATREAVPQGDNLPNMPSPTSSESQKLLKVQLDYTDGIGKRRTVTKNIEFSASSSSSGNFSGNFPGMRRQNSSSSSVWLYLIIVIIIVAIVIAFFVYKKYFYKRKNKNEKNSGKVTPDWILAEKNHRKK
jgi:hypothetical protein